MLALLPGCFSYRVLEIERRIKISGEDAAEMVFDSQKKDSLSEKPGGQSFHIFTTERYLSGLDNPDPAGRVLLKGAEEAIGKNYAEAEVLFTEAAKLVSDGSAENNLAVVFEASGRYDEAFRMYTNALLVSPDNNKFRSNFLYFLNQIYSEEKGPVKNRKR